MQTSAPEAGKLLGDKISIFLWYFIDEVKTGSLTIGYEFRNSDTLYASSWWGSCRPTSTTVEAVRTVHTSIPRLSASEGVLRQIYPRVIWLMHSRQTLIMKSWESSTVRHSNSTNNCFPKRHRIIWQEYTNQPTAIAMPPTTNKFAGWGRVQQMKSGILLDIQARSQSMMINPDMHFSTSV